MYGTTVDAMAEEAAVEAMLSPDNGDTRQEEKTNYDEGESKSAGGTGAGGGGGSGGRGRKRPRQRKGPMYEVQYKPVVGDLDSVEEFKQAEERHERGEDEAESAEGPNKSLEWRIAVHNTRERQWTVPDLYPDRPYTVRVRRIGRGDFGPPSPMLRTGPSVPGAPPPPSAPEISISSIMVQWSPPYNENGLPVREYVVQMKQFGGQFSECYRGSERVFVAVGLKPKTIHVFRVAAANRLGSSTTPPGSRSMATHLASTALRRRRFRSSSTPSHQQLIPRTPPRPARRFLVAR